MVHWEGMPTGFGMSSELAFYDVDLMVFDISAA